MKTTVDRVNTLLIYFGGAPVHPSALMSIGRWSEAQSRNVVKTLTPAHDIIDSIDRHAGIITRFKPGGALAPVGERLRRLERHVERQRECRPYFWLGEHGEGSALVHRSVTS